MPLLSWLPDVRKVFASSKQNGAKIPSIGETKKPQAAPAFNKEEDDKQRFERLACYDGTVCIDIDATNHRARFMATSEQQSRWIGMSELRTLVPEFRKDQEYFQGLKTEGKTEISIPNDVCFDPLTSANYTEILEMKPAKGRPHIKNFGSKYKDGKDRWLVTKETIDLDTVLASYARIMTEYEKPFPKLDAQPQTLPAPHN